MQNFDDLDAAFEAYVEAFRREPPMFIGVTGPAWATHLRRCVAENAPDLDAHANLPPYTVA